LLPIAPPGAGKSTANELPRRRVPW